MRLILLAVYLGIGAMLHALFIGPHFDWSSAWTFGWLLGWPVALVIAALSFWAVIACLVMAGGLLWAFWEWFKAIAQWMYGGPAR